MQEGEAEGVAGRGGVSTHNLRQGNTQVGSWKKLLIYF